MFCRMCGKSIPEDSKFCPYCGQPIEAAQEESTALPEKPHGFCERCGDPLPPGKLTGFCGKCQGEIGIEAAPYGRCEECGKPLTEDDGVLCAECVKKKFGSVSRVNNLSTQPKKKAHPVVIAFFVVIGVLCVIAYIGNNIPTSTTTAQAPSTASGSEPASSASSSPAPEVKSDLELLSSDGAFNPDINAIHITGKIKNNSGKTLSYVQIQFALYDKSGSQVGTALANTNGLEPGNTWSYDAIGMAANVSTFKAINLSGY